MVLSRGPRACEIARSPGEGASDAHLDNATFPGVDWSLAGTASRAMNLAGAFVLELCMLAAYGYWGFTLRTALVWRIAASIGVLLVVATTWAVLAAPRSIRRLQQPWLILLKLALFALAALALALTGRRVAGALLFGMASVNLALALLWKQVGVAGAHRPGDRLER
jgi:hypothetical protein